jgi:hypothetical protein
VFNKLLKIKKHLIQLTVFLKKISKQIYLVINKSYIVFLFASRDS